MEESNKKKSFSFVDILFIFIPGMIIFIILFFANTNKLEDNWIPVSELSDRLNTMDTAYLYCTSYESIQSDKSSDLITYFLLSIIMILLTLIIRYLYTKSKQKSILINPKLLLKQMKNNEIISKFNDESETKVNQMLDMEFKYKIYNMFCELQKACMEYDYTTLQKLLTKKLYNKYRIGLDLTKSKEERSFVDNFDFLSANFVDISEDDIKQCVKVHLKVKHFKYIKNLKTNEIINLDEIESIYMLELVRYKKGYINVEECPVCLMPLEKSYSECKHCNFKLDVNYDWIISNKQFIKEDM